MFSLVKTALIAVLLLGALIIPFTGCSPCDCLQGILVTVNWTDTASQTWQGANGGIVQLSVAAGSAVTIDTHIGCIGSCPQVCSWIIKNESGATMASGTSLIASFTPTSSGIYSADFDAACKDHKCPHCKINLVICQMLPPACECGDWVDPIVSWRGCENEIERVTCGGTVDVTICPYSAVTIVSGFRCSNNCTPKVEWEVINPAGGTTHGNGFTATFTPTVTGSYAFINRAWCNNTQCQDCAIKIKVNEILATSYTLTENVGIEDNFSLSGAPEPTSPSAALLSWIYTHYSEHTNPGSRNCDDILENQYWAHTFLNLVPLPCYQIQSATLTIRVYNGDLSFKNDSIGLSFITSDNSTGTWSDRLENQGVPVDSSGTITLHLNAAELAGITSNGFLDVLIQDDSAVDYARLDVTYILTSCPTPTATPTLPTAPTQTATGSG
jgi:hypothetical protein